MISGQFGIEKKLCAEPRVDALLTVTYAYLEKGVVTQAISGPFDLGRPKGCPPDAYSGGTRLNPKPLVVKHKGKKSSKKHKKASAKKAAHRAAQPPLAERCRVTRSRREPGRLRVGGGLTAPAAACAPAPCVGLR